MSTLNEPAGPAGAPASPPPVAGVPNPGSDEALSLGCSCAVLDNCHGRFAPYPPNGWWITEGCPLHWPKAGGAA